MVPGLRPGPGWKIDAASFFGRELVGESRRAEFQAELSGRFAGIYPDEAVVRGVAEPFVGPRDGIRHSAVRALIAGTDRKRDTRFRVGDAGDRVDGEFRVNDRRAS